MTNQIQIVQPGGNLAACLAAAVLCLLALTGVARAANSYAVTTTADSVDGACTPTLCSLRDAVIAADQANTVSTITLPAGGYTLTIPGTTADDPATGDLDVTGAASITITGTGAGPSATTIDANGQDRAFAVDSGAALELDNVTVRGGAPAARMGGSPNGGAVFSAGAFTARGDVFTGNTAATNGSGGAIEQAGAGALTVSATSFTDNTASTGGAIDDTGTGALTITGDTFGHPTGVGSGDHGNTAQTSGGAIADQSSASATISASTFSANRSTSGSGGALSLSGSSYVVNGNEFDANIAAANAGAIRWSHGTLTGHDDTFAANSAGALGGAIDATALQPLSLIDTTFSNNAAAGGGALAFGAATPLELVNDTLWENFAGTTNGGNAISGADRVTASGDGVQNTAIGTSNGSRISGPSCDAALPVGVDQGHNLGTDSSCLSSASDLTNPALVLSAAANNGGGVATNAEPAGAPTIDAGTNMVCPPLDARGVSRPQGAGCDIGAYEFVPPPPASTASTAATVTTASTATATTTVTASSAPTLASSPAPGATTRGALAILSTSAFLGGVVAPHGQMTTYSFQIGTTKNYGTGSVSGHTDTGPLTVETRIVGLKPNTLYHYRMVATSAGGTGYGADRMFRTLPSYTGSLVLRSSALTVHAGSVAVPLACLSARPCLLRFAITTPVRVVRTHRLGTLSFTRPNIPLVRVAAHGTVTVHTAVTAAGLALLRRAAGHKLPGTLSTRPRSNQRGIIAPVALLLR